MKKMTQLSVVLGNEPGMLSKLCGLMSEAKVNILALSVLENTDVGVIRIVVNKPEPAAKMLAEQGICFGAEEVLVVKLANKVGALAKMADKLAARKVNVNYIYGSTGTGKGKTMVVLSVDKTAAAARALAKF